MQAGSIAAYERKDPSTLEIVPTNHYYTQSLARRVGCVLMKVPQTSQGIGTEYSTTEEDCSGLQLMVLQFSTTNAYIFRLFSEQLQLLY